jgi:hypothetical protein
MIIIHIIIIIIIIINAFLYPNAFSVPSVASSQQLRKTVLRSSGFKVALCCKSYEAFLLLSRKCRKGIYNVTSFVRLPSDHGSVLH